jgi:YVTN family beta-propeller protein
MACFPSHRIDCWYGLAYTTKQCSIALKALPNWFSITLKLVSRQPIAAVVDIAKREISALVAVGRDPYGAALSPDGKQLYSGNLADNTVSVIDVASLKVVATITGFKQARLAIVFTRDGKLAYVLKEDLSISKVDRSNQKMV